MTDYSEVEHVNVGSGGDRTILELMQTVSEVVGFKVTIVDDLSKPEGTLRKLMSADKLRKLGWRPSIGSGQGVAATYDWFI